MPNPWLDTLELVAWPSRIILSSPGAPAVPPVSDWDLDRSSEVSGSLWLWLCCMAISVHTVKSRSSLRGDVSGQSSQTGQVLREVGLDLFAKDSPPCAESRP